MLKPFTTILVLLFTLNHAVNASELEGAWQLVSGEYINENNERIDYLDSGMASIKVLAGNHFSFTSEKDGKFWASGTGTYEWVNGTYTEFLLFNSFGQAHGAQFKFSAKVEGNRWYNERWDGDKRVEYEIWQRITQ